MTATVIEFPSSDHGPACNHPTRYESMGGRLLCEQCERRRTGWHECVFCSTQVPAGIRACDAHDVLECSDCAGTGLVECPGVDCHGDYCHGEGVVECGQCEGAGVIEREAVL